MINMNKRANITKGSQQNIKEKAYKNCGVSTTEAIVKPKHLTFTTTAEKFKALKESQSRIFSFLKLQ